MVTLFAKFLVGQFLQFVVEDITGEIILLLVFLGRSNDDKFLNINEPIRTMEGNYKMNDI